MTPILTCLIRHPGGERVATHADVSREDRSPDRDDFSSRILLDFADTCMMKPLPMPDAVTGPTALKFQRTQNALRESRLRWNKIG